MNLFHEYLHAILYVITNDFINVSSLVIQCSAMEGLRIRNDKMAASLQSRIPIRDAHLGSHHGSRQAPAGANAQWPWHGRPGLELARKVPHLVWATKFGLPRISIVKGVRPLRARRQESSRNA